PALARAFAAHEVAKVYHALTVRPPRLPPPVWQESSDVDGRTARTDFRRLQALSGALLVEARPQTGRKHQIRVHLAALGMPILGETRHAAAHGAVPRLMLHARSL